MLEKEVKLGGRVVSIEAFSTRRTTHTFKAAAALFKRYGDLQDDMITFRRDYGQQHPRTITREMCDDAATHHRERAAEADSDEQRELHEAAAARWERRLETVLKERDRIELPGEPTVDEVIVHVLPKAIENAEEEVARLLGLIMLSNEKFAETRKAARKEGIPLDEVLLEEGDQVLDETDPEELLDLLQAGMELFLGDMETRRERVGKLLETARKAFGIKQPEPDSPTADSTASSEASSESSTSSDEPTDGTKAESSTESPSAALSTSAS